MTEFQRALQRARKAAGGRRQLAEALGISARTLEKWEWGTRTPMPFTRRAVCDALISLSQIKQMHSPCKIIGCH